MKKIKSINTWWIKIIRGCLFLATALMGLCNLFAGANISWLYVIIPAAAITIVDIVVLGIILFTSITFIQNHEKDGFKYK